MENKIRKILLHYGNLKQKRKAVEELAELIIAVAKDERQGVLEEIADSEIVISQLKKMYFIDNEEVEEIKEAKLERTLQRMKSGK